MRVNGQIVRDPDQWVDLHNDRVTLDGKPLRAAAPRYILLYKPTGYLTTCRDPQGRPTVYDLTRGVGMWLAPVGRLDLETSGLLLMTNDTDFAEHIASPLPMCPKPIRRKPGAFLPTSNSSACAAVWFYPTGPLRPAEVRRLRDGPRHTFLEITLTEGRNRQVRRILEAVESKVLKLVRTAIGPVRLGELPIGAWRDLTGAELAALGYVNPGSGGSPRTRKP